MIVLLTIIFTILIIGFHELAHLFAAKMVNCCVELFSIGFGRPFYSFEFKKIRFNIAPILLGGYVRIKGELELSNDKDAFCNLTYRKNFFLFQPDVYVILLWGLFLIF